MLDNRYAFLEFSAHFPLPSRERVAAIYGLVISGPTTADDDCLPCRMSAMPYTVPLSIVRTLSEFYGSPGKNRFSIQIGLISSTVIGNSIFLGVIQLTGGASRYSYMNIWALLLFLYVYIPLPQLSSSIDALKLGGQRDDGRTLQPFFGVLAQVLEGFSGDMGVKGGFAGVLFRHITIGIREGEKTWDGG
jgi:hypothetical protein